MGNKRVDENSIKNKKTLICKNCGKEFQGHPNAKYCLQCFPDHNKRSSLKSAAKHRGPFFCEYCGKEIPYIPGEKRFKYCYEHRDPKSRKSPPRICIVCGKEFQPCARRPDARFCSRKCQGHYINDTGQGPKHNDKELKERIINYFKLKGIPMSAGTFAKEIGISLKAVYGRKWSLIELAKEAGISEPYIPKNISKFEKFIYEILCEMFNKSDIYTQKSFKDCKNKNRLRFDFYIKSLNLIIEADGPQHFKYCSWFTDPHENDNIKNSYCKQRHIHIFRIRYRKYINKSLLKEILSQLLPRSSEMSCIDNCSNCWKGLEIIPISSEDFQIKEITFND